MSLTSYADPIEKHILFKKYIVLLQTERIQTKKVAAYNNVLFQIDINVSALKQNKDRVRRRKLKI